MDYAEAMKWCHENRVSVEFYVSHVEVSYGSGFYTSSEVDFLDAVKELKRILEED